MAAGHQHSQRAGVVRVRSYGGAALGLLGAGGQHVVRGRCAGCQRAAADSRCARGRRVPVCRVCRAGVPRICALNAGY